MKPLYKTKLVAALSVAAMATVLSSCYKKYDPKTYAPAFTINGFTSSRDIATTSLVAYWAFDGNLIDSVSGTAGTNTGTSFAGGFKKQALKGALNSYVSFTPTAAIKSLQSFTISYWINTPQDPNGIIEPISIVNAGQFWSNLDMFFDGQTPTSSVFKIHLFGNSGNSEAWLTSWSITNPWSKWQQITLTYDKPSETFTLYLNGAKLGSSVQTGFGAPNFASAPAIIFGTVQFQTTPSSTTATDSQPWASFLTGQLDEVRIYNKALSPAEVNALVVLQGKGK